MSRFKQALRIVIEAFRLSRCQRLIGARIASWALLSIASTGLVDPAHAQDQDLLSPLFQSSMVLQADRPINFSGYAAAGEEVRVTLGEQDLRVRADAKGYWRVSSVLQRQEAAIEIGVETASGEKTVLNDVLVGDVWLCSGQSNMQWPVRFAANSERVLRAAYKSKLRLAKIERTSVGRQLVKPNYEIAWSAANEDTLADFSSVCWHMGLNLEQNVEGHIGLLQSAVGGSRIEDWISLEGLRPLGGIEEVLSLAEAYAADPKLAKEELWRRTNEWASQYDLGVTGKGNWSDADLDDSDWAVIDQPESLEQAGAADLEGFNGVVWLRGTLVLSAEQVAQQAIIALGRVNERDSIWINGQHVGETEIARIDRRYPISPGVLREGENSIAIRVIDIGGSGGLSSRNNPWRVEFFDGSQTSLPKRWRYKIGWHLDRDATLPRVPWEAPRGYTTLYNGMIAPLGDLSIKGVAWYQGESNTRDRGNPAYADLFKLLLDDWRRHFDDPELPVVIAQLPSYRSPSPSPGQKSNWAILRDSQRVAANADENVGLAVTIDRGWDNDVHPSHKREVGKRIAAEALRVAYGKIDQPAQFYPSSVKRVGGQILVAYPSELGQLKTIGATVPIGFELCDVDGICEFATGRLAGATVILDDAERKAAFVVYAWADFPITNFFSADGAPAVPFRIAVPASDEEASASK